MRVERWDIWQAPLDPVFGAEQGMTRPVLVISETALNDILPVVNVLPLTSRKAGRRVYPNEVLLPRGIAGLTADSIVLCFQIRTLDKGRFTRHYGTLTDPSLQREIIEALRFQLSI